jgi:sec-independent protein translocase protein TatA
MFGRFGPEELIIILVIVILVFGPGRIGKVASEIGTSIKAFRDGLNKKEDEPSSPTESQNK